MDAPAFNFDASHESLAPFKQSAASYLTTHNLHWDGLATGCLVFHPASGKLLTVQRASHDSMPNRWEVPGGAADPTDETLLHAAARELWEESRLVAARFVRFIPGSDPANVVGDVFTNRTGRRVFSRLTFLVEVDDCEAVAVDPNEHQAYAWVTEDEVRAQRAGGRDMPITSESQRAIMLRAFELRKSIV